MEQSIAYVDSHSYHLALLGHFDDAAKLVEQHLQNEALGPGEKVQSLRALARIHCQRGYALTARDILSKAVDISSSELQGDNDLALKIQWLFVQLMCCSVDIAEAQIPLAAQVLVAEATDIDILDRDQVELISNTYRISALKRLMKRTWNDKSTSKHRKSLRNLLDQALALKRWADFYCFFVTYNIIEENSELVNWLRKVVAREDLPDIFRGRLSIELFKHLVANCSLGELEPYVQTAQVAFTNCDCTLGLSEVRLRRLQHGLLPSSNGLNEQIEILNEYIAVDYPLGVLDGALSLLSTMFSSGNIRGYVLLHESFRNVAKAAGFKLQQTLLETQLLAALNAGTGHYGRVVELGRTLFEECKIRHFWSIACQVGRVLSLAHHQAGDHNAAEQIAAEIYDLSQRESLEGESEALYHLANIRASRPILGSATALKQCQDVIAILSPTISQDVGRGESELACQKLQLIAQMQYQLSRSDISNSQSWKDAMLRSMSIGRENAKALAPAAQLDVNGNFDDLRITQLLSDGRPLLGNENELQAITICNELIAAYRAQNHGFRVAMKTMMRALCHQQMYQKATTFQTKAQSLDSAEQDYRFAAELLCENQIRTQILVARHGHVRLYREAWLFYNIPCDDVYSQLSLAEDAADTLRRELSAFGSLEALLNKQHFVANPQVRDLYSWANEISIKERRLEQLWLWSQKRKARSLSDMLGLGVVIPATAIEAVTTDSQGRDLFAEFTALHSSLSTTSERERAYVRQHIEDVETKLRGHTAFRSFMNIRDGSVPTISQLSKLEVIDRSVATERRVIFAEWIIHNNDLYLLTLDTGAGLDSSQLFELSLKQSDVVAWIQQHFTIPAQHEQCLAEGETRSPFRQLDALLSPLSQVTSPGDLIILSPTGCLDTIPLHVLLVHDLSNEGSSCLLQRNPIVYTSSCSITQICLNRSVDREIHGSPAYVSVYDQTDEAQEIYQQLEDISNRHKGSVHLGSDVTKERLPDQIQNAPLIHYHGHCTFKAGNVLKQALILSRSMSATLSAPDSAVEGQASSSTDYEDGRLRRFETDATGSNMLSSEDNDTVTHFTVEDIFKLQLKSPLVVLLACQSAAQQISAGDEPLGLISGLLCAGAASVIGASWPIPSIAGRKFSEAFYDQLYESEGGQFADVALALQEAALTIRDEAEYASPYYWGAFCLHGSWVYRR